MNSNQFVLSWKQLGKTYGTAISECQFIMMVPKNIMKVEKETTLTIPMLVHCDQSGGREDLTCLVK